MLVLMIFKLLDLLTGDAGFMELKVSDAVPKTLRLHLNCCNVMKSDISP